MHVNKHSKKKGYSPSRNCFSPSYSSIGTDGKKEELEGWWATGLHIGCHGGANLGGTQTDPTDAAGEG